ncbi:arylsulfatase A-like enzyme [Neorhizobium sp. R1-B]|uniref:sulfatase n=1 Tax=unclassified Neorhizobium TaxID=2629175 RepID=UPI00104E0813|nr:MULTISPECIES: sulfatase [unclassified Neorhizobium]TCV74533.1 arylsulfatase A-like enzyme [Neorhizobium sp. S3-V5DH]TDX87719.1 arylsulfatase A-like enzyme [Neorhizobium sp. R1-B]
MRLIFLLFDSLNRSALGAYGGKIETPNFDRLAARSVTFDSHYVGSLPCIPARRDIQTGRANFFHRSWGPMEPYDTSFCEMLRAKGIYSHLVTDHFHYFQNGGSGYNTRYDSWDFIRGQEYDTWKAVVEPPLAQFAEEYDQRHYDPKKKPGRIVHAINRLYEKDESDLPTPRCFASAFEFLEANKSADNWMLQLELFDPHEPFHAPSRFRREGDSNWKGGVLNWPDYVPVNETDDEIAEIRANYAAQIRMLDEYLGRLFDFMDSNEMWSDTAIVLSTDHGFLLGEHGWWGKSRMPYYEEMSHIPLIVYHPAHAEQAGQRLQVLTQTVDIMPTILDVFGIPPETDVTGRSLLSAVAGKTCDDRIIAFGLFAGPIGVTDGRYVMLHYPPDVLGDGLCEYTLMPQHMVQPFTAAEMATARMAPPFNFTKSMPLLRIEATREARRPPNLGGSFLDQGFRLFDLQMDPQQQKPIRDANVEARLYEGLRHYMQAHDAPAESYGWQGL